jgi:hypothetical protein
MNQDARDVARDDDNIVIFAFYFYHSPLLFFISIWSNIFSLVFK